MPFPRTSRRKFLWWSAGVTVLLVILAGWGIRNSLSKPSVEVSFIGYKSNPQGALMAGFKITNASPFTITWSGRYSITSPGKPPVITQAPSMISALGPKQIQTVWMLAPTNETAWRIDFDYKVQDWVHRLGRWMVRSSIGAQVHALLSRMPVRRTQTAESDWVNQ